MYNSISIVDSFHFSSTSVPDRTQTLKIHFKHKCLLSVCNEQKGLAPTSISEEEVTTDKRYMQVSSFASGGKEGGGGWSSNARDRAHYRSILVLRDYYCLHFSLNLL